MNTLSLAHLRRVLTTAICVTSLVACAGDDAGDDGSTSSTGATTSATTSSSDTTSDTTSDATSDASDTTSDASDATSDASASGPTSDASDSATEGGPTSTDGTTGGTSSDPTTGGTMGVGLSGLEAYCDHYVDCGGTYYEDSQACVDASLNYWGACPSRRDALDAFGDCMLGIACGDWNPDSYNPASTECAGEWQALGDSEPC